METKNIEKHLTEQEFEGIINTAKDLLLGKVKAKDLNSEAEAIARMYRSEYNCQIDAGAPNWQASEFAREVFQTI